MINIKLVLKMKNIRYIFQSLAIATVIVLLGYSNISAQQNNTLFYMFKIPQSNWLNPAIQHDCKIFAGIPVLSSIHLNYGNNGFAFNQLIHKGTGEQADSLVIDKDLFISKIRPVNYITLENHINLLSGAYKWKDYYFSLYVSEKIDFKTSIPDDLIYMANEFNGWFILDMIDGTENSMLGNVMDLNGLSLSFTHYREYAVGCSKVIGDKWTAGARAKILFGKANAWTTKNDLTLKTDDEDFAYTINSDIEYNMSQPFYTITEFYFDNAVDSIKIEGESNEDFNVSDYILNAHNLGFGIDLGGIYKLNEDITLYGSLLDLGYIKWKDNITNLTQDNTFYYDGYDTETLISTDNSVLDALEGNVDSLLGVFQDSLVRIFSIDHTQESYISYLSPKLHLLGTYKYNDKMYFGILARAELFQKKINPSLTLSCNTNFFDWLTAAGSYTIMYNTFTNVGLGFAAKYGPVQFYMLTDNIWAIWPQSTRNVNLRFGFNLLFGCGPKETSTLID